ncbi:MAG TPA: class I SAM-dependent methyltransferase [Chitinophagaceae bacterium]|nr:class I SAM-dependent methyltransferase [Chitinophagaceae bacterium]
MNEHDKYFESNKKIWNQRTKVHRDSSFYDLEGFRKGKIVLTPIELNELGDVNGKSMLHLQCHFGMDSLNWARLGAKVTGIDISDEAIRVARELNEELHLDAEFHCCNLYDLHPAHMEASGNWPLGKKAGVSFDIVFTSYGTIGWLPDLDKWAQTIAWYLRPGGIFYMAEFHPVAWMFDDEFTHIKYFYDNRELITVENYGTYTDRNAAIAGTEYSWNHSISEVLNALLKNGLHLSHFNEFMYSPYSNFAGSVQGEDGNWRISGMEGKIPLVYSLKAIKAG